MRFCLRILFAAVIGGTAGPAPVSAQAPAADHVLLISVDGLHAGHLESLLVDDPAGDFVSFQRLVDEGVWTFDARTDFTHTITVPNHVTMLTGRPVLQPASQPETAHHGYIYNVEPDTLDTLHNRGNPALAYVTSVFDVVHDHGLATSAFVSKSKLEIVGQSYDAQSGAPDLIAPDDGPAKIDTWVRSTNLPALNADLVNQLGAGPAHFTFVHYHAPDIAGHEFGWESPEWIDSVREIAGYLQSVLAAIEGNPALAGRTTVILTADHGGSGTGHGDPGTIDHFRIPFFVWGAGTAADLELYSLNLATREHPGIANPSYDFGRQPIRNGDAANLALGLLGLPSVPGSLINRAQDLQTEPAATVSSGIPAGVLRLTASPNPSNPRTVLRFSLTRPGSVTLRVYDLAGREVGRLADEVFPAGRHVRVFADPSLPSGVYVARLQAGGEVLRRKFTIVR